MKIQRTLPPAAAPLSWRDLVHGLIGFARERHVLEKLDSEFREYFGMKHVFFVSSGKAALTLILLGLSKLSSRRKVLIPGYTCFSVPSAVVKAGLTVTLCDIQPASLDFNYDDLERSLDADVLCVVCTHLLGFSGDVDRVKAVCQGRGIYVVEDVAQAFGGKQKGQLLGTRGDVAFLSFGRGKNMTCGSGGVILTNSDAIGQAIRVEYDRLGKESAFGILNNWCQTLAMRVLINPWLYWFPAGLPFLKLGETKFYRDFPIYRLDGVRAGLLSHWRQELELSNRSRRLQAGELIRRLAIVSDVARPLVHPDAVYLRLPVLMKNKKLKEDLCALSKRDGLGVSPFYPTDIEAVPELKGMFEDKELIGSRLLSDCVVTLPTHHLVSARDIDAIVALLAKLRETLPRSSSLTNLGQRQALY